MFPTKTRKSQFWDWFWINFWINSSATKNGVITLPRCALTSLLRGPNSRNIWDRRKVFLVLSLWSKLGRRRRGENIKMSARNLCTSSYGGIKKSSTQHCKYINIFFSYNNFMFWFVQKMFCIYFIFIFMCRLKMGRKYYIASIVNAHRIHYEA